MARGQQEGAHGGGQAHAYGAAVRPQMPHSVENCHTRRYRATRGVDIDGDVLLLISCVQVQQLRLCERTPWAFQSAPPLLVTLAAACWSLKRGTSYTLPRTGALTTMRFAMSSSTAPPSRTIRCRHIIPDSSSFETKNVAFISLAGAMSSMLA